MIRPTPRSRPRRGATVPLTAILMVFLCAMIAFAVDIGYLLMVKAEAQNAADSAAMAGMNKLAERLKASPIKNGIPTQTAADLQAARDEAKAFCRKNPVGGVALDLQDSEIEIGYMADPLNQSNNTLDTGGWPARPYNAVRVRVSRDKTHGGAVTLFFARVLGIESAEVGTSATAAYVMGTAQPKGNTGSYSGGLLPFTFQADEWNAVLAATSAGQVTAPTGAVLTVTDLYTVDAQSKGSAGVHPGGDGTVEVKLFPDVTTSGNFGTINFSKTKVSNSTSTLRDVIINGPTEAAWPDLPSIAKASPSSPVSVNGDPGISAGLESAIDDIIGEMRILPLYKTVSGTGNNTFYNIVGFTPVTVVAADLQGGNKYILIQPRIAAQGSMNVGGTKKLKFDITPTEKPNPMFMGNRALVR